MYSYIKSVFPSLLPHPSNFNFISDISNLSKTCWCNTWMIPNGIQVYGRRESRLKSSLEIHFQVCVAFWTLNIGWNISIVSKYIHWKLNLVWNINFKFAELQIFILLFCTRWEGEKEYEMYEFVIRRIAILPWELCPKKLGIWLPGIPAN